MNYSRLSTEDRLTLQYLRQRIDSRRLLVKITNGKQYAIDELVRLENQYLERFGECYGRHWGAKEDHRNSDSGAKQESSAGQGTRSGQRTSQGSGLGVMQLPYHYGVNSRGKMMQWYTTNTTSVNFSNAFYNTFIEHARRELELETVYEEQPIIAARFATLDRLYGGFCLRSLNGMVLNRDSNAICNSTFHPTDEKIPFSGCSCGFYAVPPDTLYYNHSCPRDSAVVLLVELSGTVIEHEVGYRAQHQKILEIQPKRCEGIGHQCSGVRDLIIDDSGKGVYCSAAIVQFFHYLNATIKPPSIITLKEVARRMGIPYGNPSC